MRIIKFRAWIQGNDMTYDVDVINGEPKVGGVRWVGGKLMQFTGLLDKNGKEIYEGDIVNWKQALGGVLPPNENTYVCQIQWGRIGWICEEIKPLKDDFHSCFTLASCHIEIVGNIYENPELLK